MKKLVYIFSILLLAQVSAVYAATVIMDAVTLNGDFEDGTGSTSRNFNTVDDWVNEGTGFDFETIAVQENLGSTGVIDTGAWNATIDDNGLDGIRVHTVATSYQIMEGDSFNLSFDWRDAGGWQNGDLAVVRLVSFEGAFNSTIAWSYALSDTRSSTAIWESESGTSPTVGSFAAANGGLLYIQVYGITGEFGTEGDFARVDNISVTSIPEPSTFLLVGGALGFFGLLRRRKK